MEPEQEKPRDLAAMVIAQLGRLVATDDPWMPYRLVDENGASVEAVSAWLPPGTEAVKQLGNAALSGCTR